MNFEEAFILFLTWCNDNKKYCVSNEVEFWDGVSTMMSKLSTDYEEYSDIILLYILQLEIYYKELKKQIEQSELEENKKEVEN